MSSASLMEAAGVVEAEMAGLTSGWGSMVVDERVW